MAPQTLILVVALISMSYAIENLKLAYQWKLVDFQYPSMRAKQDALNSGEFIPENNLPLGIEVFGDRLFITIPRWKTGVPASLTYINLKDKTSSPILHPYPNWAAHRLPASKDGEAPEIVSPFRVRADRCGRLWVLDTGVADIFGKPHAYSPSRVTIYDLRTDTLIRQFKIPGDQTSKSSFLANIVVEDEDCANAYGYFGDLGDPAIIVYSFKMNSSWRIKHHYFNYNPLFAEFNVAGSKFVWLDGVFGMGLTPPGPDGVSTLYFHPMTGTHEFAVSTRHLRNSSLAESNFHKFRVVGSRGPNGQSSVSFLDKKSGVLFYALVNHNAVGCWKTSNPTYSMENQGRIHENDETMIFPNDIKVDANDNIWVLSDRLPIFLYSKLNVTDVNFRIFVAPVSEAVKNTVCDPNPGATPLSNPASPGVSSGDLPEVFNKFNRPNNRPSTIARPQGNSDKRTPIQAFAVAEIPNMGNKFKPTSNHFPGNPDLAFMFHPNPNPLQSPTVFNNFQSPTRVPAQVTMTRDENGNSKKGYEFLINVPVNLYISVENT